MMKRFILIQCLLFAFLFSNAQIIDFTKADPQPDLIEIYSGSSDSGDVDGDGDKDLIMTGITPSKRTRLYLNDGSGNFTEKENIPMPNASEGHVIFEDLDGDGDLDLFFSGNGFNIQEFAHIYLNDGQGEFTELANPNLPQFSDTGANIADVDGDGDKDLLIALKAPNGNFIADVYFNDGNAIFTPSGSTALTAVQFGAVQFIDIENDGDADVMISGEQGNGTGSTKLYINDGFGNYIVDTNTVFEQLAGVIDVADTDNDGDLDILMSGASDDFNVRTILYINDGLGQFTELSSTGLQETFAGTNEFADLDNDGDQDLIIIGSQDGGLPNIYNIVYENLSNNVFSPVDTLGGEYIAACVIDDFNGDALADIIIQGFVEKTTVYWNTSTLTSLDEIAEIPMLNIFPNPSSGELTIDLGGKTTQSDLYIYSADGRLVYEQKNLSGSKTVIELDLLSGNYIVVVESDEMVVTRKLMIVR